MGLRAEEVVPLTLIGAGRLGPAEGDGLRGHLRAFHQRLPQGVVAGLPVARGVLGWEEVAPEVLQQLQLGPDGPVSFRGLPERGAAHAFDAPRLGHDRRLRAGGRLDNLQSARAGGRLFGPGIVAADGDAVERQQQIGVFQNGDLVAVFQVVVGQKGIQIGADLFRFSFGIDRQAGRILGLNGRFMRQVNDRDSVLKLQDTIPIIDLPHEAAIQTQNAAGLPIYSERETEQIRANLNALLAHHNLKDGDKVAVLENTDLLLALDRITVGCHNAWPKQPPAGARRLQVVETAASTKPPIVPKAWRIEGMRSAALWQTPEGNWAIGAKLELLQHFWRDLFPAQYASSDWQAGYHALRQSLMEGPQMPAQAVTLGRPETPGADQRQWDDLFGPQAHEGSLAVVAQRLGNHILGEMLLRSSSVKAVDPAAIEAIESQQQAEAIDDGQDDAHRPR